MIDVSFFMLWQKKMKLTRLRTMHGAKLGFKGVTFNNMNWTTYMMMNL